MSLTITFFGYFFSLQFRDIFSDFESRILHPFPLYTIFSLTFNSSTNHRLFFFLEHSLVISFKFSQCDSFDYSILHSPLPYIVFSSSFDLPLVMISGPYFGDIFFNFGTPILHPFPFYTIYLSVFHIYLCSNPHFSDIGKAVLSII